MELRYITPIFILILLILECFPKRNFMMKISQMKCIPKTEIINITCSETKSNRVAGLNIFVSMTEDVYEMRYDLDVKYRSKKDAVWESFFKFKNIDICEFLSAKFTVPILLIGRNMMRKFSNYPEECPFKKDTLYYVQRMKFDPEQFPPYFPEGEFISSGVIYNQNHTFVEYIIGIVVVSKKNRGEKS